MKYFVGENKGVNKRHGVQDPDNEQRDHVDSLIATALVPSALRWHSTGLIVDC